MYHKIREAQMGDREEGFTLIELLVVVIIIGILAAIAIPVFLSQREKARNSAANSDLRNLITAEEAHYTDADDYTQDLGELQTSGFTQSAGVVQCVVNNNDDTFSAETYHPDGTLYFYYESDVGQIQKVEAYNGLADANCFTPAG